VRLQSGSLSVILKVRAKTTTVQLNQQMPYSWAYRTCP